MATQENTPAPLATVPDSEKPGLSLLLYVLGTLCLGVAIIGGCIVGNSHTTAAGWIVFGCWSLGAIALFVVGKALHYLARIAAASEFSAYGQAKEAQPEPTTGTAEGWLARPQP